MNQTPPSSSKIKKKKKKKKAHRKHFFFTPNSYAVERGQSHSPTSLLHLD
jgi:hypothetical protein